MTQTDFSTTMVSASALLRAWIRGDASRLESELSRSIDQPDAGDESMGGEESALLNAIARRMCECPDPFVDPGSDPALDLCINLLFHIVSQNGLLDQTPLAWMAHARRATGRRDPWIQSIRQ
jgi:hypothetical protein